MNDVQEAMRQNEERTLTREVLDQHFGLRESGRAVCATCKDTPWPCPPARLAQSVQERLLAE